MGNIVYLGSATPSSGSGGGSGGDAVWGSITGTLSNQTDLQTALNGKQNTLTAGSGISIVGDVISATYSVSYDGTTISENSSNELQAIGVIDKQSGDAVNTWIGSEQQYENGATQQFYAWSVDNFDVDYVFNGHHVSSIVYGNNLYVAFAGDNDVEVYYSTDKQTWTYGALLGGGYTQSCFGAGKFVIVNVENGIYYSTDAINWTNLSSYREYTRIAFGEINNTPIFVATKYDDIIYSNDGVTWNQATLPQEIGANVDACAICFDGIQFTVIPYSSDFILTSTDGNNWTYQETLWGSDEDFYTDSAAGGVINGVSYNIVLDNSYGKIKLQTNGGSWEDQGTIVEEGGEISFSGNSHIVFTDNKIVIVDFDSKIFESTITEGNLSFINTTTLTTEDPAGEPHTECILYDGSSTLMIGLFDAIALYKSFAYSSTAGGYVYTAQAEPIQGSTIYLQASGASAISNVKYQVSSYSTGAIVLNNGDSMLYDSTHNETGVVSIGILHPEYLCYINDVGVKKADKPFVEVNNGKVDFYQGTKCIGSISMNQSKNTRIDLPLYNESTINLDNLNRLQTVGILNKGLRYDNEDPISIWNGDVYSYNHAQIPFYAWSVEEEGHTSQNVNFEGDRMAYGNNKYVSTLSNNNYGYDVKVSSSLTNSEWASYNTYTRGLKDICFGNNTFVVVGTDGASYSSDGETWTATSSTLSGTFTRVAYGELNGTPTFVTFNTNSKIYYSIDNGATWSEISQYPSGTMGNNDLSDICFGGAYGNGKFVIISRGGVIYETTNLADWTVTNLSQKGFVYDGMNDLVAITYKRGYGFLIITRYGDIAEKYSSFDWNYYQSSFRSPDNCFIDVATDGSTDEIIARGGYVYQHSSSGWSPMPKIDTYLVGSVIYADNKFVITGQQKVFYTGLQTSYYYTLVPEPQPYVDRLYYGLDTTDILSDVAIESYENNQITLNDSRILTYAPTHNNTGVTTIESTYPEYLCFIEEDGIKRDGNYIANYTTVDQIYNGTSANAQSGVAIAGVLGDIETLLSQI